MPNGTGTQAGSTSAKDGRSGTSGTMQSCIEACTECHQVCLETVQQCLQMGGTHAGAEHVRTLLDCAEICRSSADFMIRGSEHHPLTCHACAEICRACAESCDRLGGAEMQRCAEVCRRCADSCARMAATGHAH